MPIFEYECSTCHRQFEELVFTDSQPPHCPHCGGAGKRIPSCACLHTPSPSRAGQNVSFPSTGKSACAGCSATSCATCK